MGGTFPLDSVWREEMTLLCRHKLFRYERRQCACHSFKAGDHMGSGGTKTGALALAYTALLGNACTEPAADVSRGLQRTCTATCLLHLPAELCMARSPLRPQVRPRMATERLLHIKSLCPGFAQYQLHLCSMPEELAAFNHHRSVESYSRLAFLYISSIIILQSQWQSLAARSSYV